MATSLEESLRHWRLHRDSPPPSFDQLYDMGRRVRNCVVSLRDKGEDYQEAEDLLRRIDKLCKGELEQWQSTQQDKPN